jgi:translation initiation factor 1
MTKERLVYSSDHGRICTECQKPADHCICKESARLQVLGDGNVKLRRETKGRGGKTVVVVSGLALDQKQLQSLVAELKRLCGSGGTVKDGIIEIQGEHLDKIREALFKKGHKPKG